MSTKREKLTLGMAVSSFFEDALLISRDLVVRIINGLSLCVVTGESRMISCIHRYRDEDIDRCDYQL